VIEIRNLTVEFGGVRGLNGLSVDIGAKITGLVGPNGAGKTTLLNVMSGFVKPVVGTVIVDGQDLLRIGMSRRAAFGVRRTFQTEQVVENLSVWNNIAAALDNVATGGRPRRAIITEALDYVGMGRYAERVGASLNASERRLIEIARCILARPRVIMMDEPGAGLSENEAEHLRRVILGIPGFCGAQVLLVDHDVDLITAICEETLVLDFGSQIAFGPTAQVLTDPKVQAAYLGTVTDEAA
jgi:branched-chain amino acid transport system ATP-binding protein